MISLSANFLKAKDVMVKEVVKVNSCTLVDNAVKMMNKNSIGCLIIEDDGEARGIVTQGDLLEKVLEKAKDPSKLAVSDIMTKKLVVESPDMEIHKAARLILKRRIKKLPIVENGKLIGLITLTNIARTVSVDQEMISIVERLSKVRAI
jgi:CBS domain-containing protein